MKLERFALYFSVFMLLALLFFLLAPIAVTIAVSFTEGAVFSFPPKGFSLRWYERALEIPELMDSIWLSAQLALLATVISLVMGTFCAIALVRKALPASEAIATFLVSPLMLPGLVLGIAILQASREVGLRDTWTTLLLAHVVITMPFVMRTVLSSLSQFDFSMIDAARTLGLSQAQAMRKVLVPNILPGFLSGALFAFIASFDNYPISMFLVDVRTKTLPITLLNQIEMSPDPTLAAVSALLILATILALLLCDRLVGMRKIASV